MAWLAAHGTGNVNHASTLSVSTCTCVRVSVRVHVCTPRRLSLSQSSPTTDTGPTHMRQQPPPLPPSSPCLPASRRAGGRATPVPVAAGLLRPGSAGPAQTAPAASDECEPAEACRPSPARTSAAGGGAAKTNLQGERGLTATYTLETCEGYKHTRGQHLRTPPTHARMRERLLLYCLANTRSLDTTVYTYALHTLVHTPTHPRTHAHTYKNMHAYTHRPSCWMALTQ